MRCSIDKIENVGKHKKLIYNIFEYKIEKDKLEKE